MMRMSQGEQNYNSKLTGACIVESIQVELNPHGIIAEILFEQFRGVFFLKVWDFLLSLD